MRYLNKENRPWGKFHVLHEGEGYKIKKIDVDLDGRLSYQFHKHRSEHWIIIEGDALVTLNNDEKKYTKGDIVFIPKKAPHRIQNIGNKTLEFIEVQTGTYFGEDDIVRIEDDYKRN